MVEIQKGPAIRGAFFFGDSKMIGPDDSQLRRSVVKHEALRLAVYDDKTGKPLQRGDTLQGYATIGYGVNLHAGISDSEAQYLLDNRLATAFEDAARYDWFPRLTDMRQRVIVEMVYNLGAGTFATFEKMISAISVGDFTKARAEMLDSKWAVQVGDRATKLANQMLLGK